MIDLIDRRGHPRHRGLARISQNVCHDLSPESCRQLIDYGQLEGRATVVWRGSVTAGDVTLS
jgi:hypothetical protein